MELAVPLPVELAIPLPVELAVPLHVELAVPLPVELAVPLPVELVFPLPVELAVPLPDAVWSASVLLQYTPKSLNYFVTINDLQQTLPNDLCVIHKNYVYILV